MSLCIPSTKLFSSETQYTESRTPNISVCPKLSTPKYVPVVCRTAQFNICTNSSAPQIKLMDQKKRWNQRKQYVAQLSEKDQEEQCRAWKRQKSAQSEKIASPKHQVSVWWSSPGRSWKTWHQKKQKRMKRKFMRRSKIEKGRRRNDARLQCTLILHQPAGSVPTERQNGLDNNCHNPQDFMSMLWRN